MAKPATFSSAHLGYKKEQIMIILLVVKVDMNVPLFIRTLPPVFCSKYAFQDSS